MLNTNNYFQKAQDIDWDSLPEALAKGHKLVQGASQNNWAAYNSNENIKRVVDAFFVKLNEYLDKTPKATRAPSLPSKTKTEAAAPKKVPTPKNYKGLRVEIRPASSGSSKFIVWDLKTDQKFANERFDSIEEAKEFISDNEMTLVRVVEAEQKVEYKTEDVEHIDTDVQFIKRYAAKARSMEAVESCPLLPRPSPSRTTRLKESSTRKPEAWGEAISRRQLFVPRSSAA